MEPQRKFLSTKKRAAAAAQRRGVLAKPTIEERRAIQNDLILTRAVEQGNITGEESQHLVSTEDAENPGLASIIEPQSSSLNNVQGLMPVVLKPATVLSFPQSLGPSATACPSTLAQFRCRTPVVLTTSTSVDQIRNFTQPLPQQPRKVSIITIPKPGLGMRPVVRVACRGDCC